MNKNNKKVINAWAMYDWANSVYSLVITSAIFPVYYHNVALSSTGSEIVNFFGLEIINSVLYSYALSFSFLLVAVILPLLSGMADYAGKKKFFMKIFVYLGAFSCIGLFFLPVKISNGVSFAAYWLVLAIPVALSFMTLSCPKLPQVISWTW